MYISEIEIDFFGEIHFHSKQVPLIKETTKGYVVNEDDESYDLYIPRSETIFKDLGKSKTKNLREDGYAVEGHILYTGDKSYSVFTKDPEVGKEIVRKEALRILEENKDKINKHIEIISKF